MFFKRLTKYKFKTFLILGLITTSLGILGYFKISKIFASTSPWTQTNWSGGQSDSLITTNATTYKSESNMALTTELSIQAAGSWSSNYSNWMYRRKITFDNTDASLGVTSEDLTNFPVLVVLKSGTNINYTLTQDNGEDIRFEDPNGTTLSYEIEEWDEGGSSYVWVKIPQIDQDSDTDYVYMYYGNDSASDGQDAANVWRNSYTGVWHMNNIPTGSILDSLGVHNGTPTGGMGSNQLVDGLNGKGLDFDATNTITLGSSDSLRPANTKLESWVKAEYFDYYLGIISTMPSWGTGFSLQIHPDRMGAMVSGAYLNATINPEIEIWYHVVATHNSSQINSFYAKGVLLVIS